jgi:hypothetical protein
MNLEDLTNYVAQEAPTVSVPLRDSIDTARGYRQIDEVWTCIPDSMYPWDPEVLKSIREFAPDTVPLWRLSVFFAPNTRNIVVFGRHALGRHIEQPGYDLTPFRCSMPTMPCQGVSFKRPNKVWFVHEGVRNKDFQDVPGTYLPFDFGLAHRARESVGNLPSLSEQEFRRVMMREMVDGVLEERERRRAELADDFEERRKEFAPYAQKLIDRVSDVEIDEWMGSIGRRGRAKKPMVLLNGDYPRGE